MILIEVLKQLETYQGFQRTKQKAAVTFLFFIGNMQESCPSTQATEGARLEMQRYPFTSYKSRIDFDPHHNIGVINGWKYEHKEDLEDYWANAVDEYEVKKRLWSRLPLSLVRTTKLFRIPDQLEDDGDHIQSGFDVRQPLPPIR